MGNIIDYAEQINKELDNGAKRVEVEVIDYKNEKEIVCFWKNQDVNKKILYFANMLGDGNEVKEVRVYREKEDLV